MIIRKKLRGVTFVELMVVIVIIGILSVVALPSYRQFVQRSQRIEAKEALIRLAANQERFYLQNNSYTVNLAALGFANNETPKGLYQIEVVGADTQGFNARATPATGSTMIADVDCQTFTIDEAGEQLAAPDPSGKCW